MLPREKVRQLRKDAARTTVRLPLVFNALGDAGRYRIFMLLTKYQQMCVTDIAHIFNISVPAASQQLKLMEMSGLVQGRRNGQMICYSIQKNVSLVRSMIKLISKEE